ncbi:MAG: two-component regulator propeller domain-containing protein [Bacteroidota bacterium]
MIKCFKITVFCFGFLFCLQLANFQLKAQQYNFKNYSVENGLPYVQIFALYQDNLGYLWSGGYGGASKFNGKTFQHYSPKNGLANHFINCINQYNHQILIGTIDGLSVIDNFTKKVIQNYDLNDGLPSNKINALCSDFKSKIWIGTPEGLCFLEKGKIKIVEELKKIEVNCLFYSISDGLWIGTDKGLYQLKKNKFTNYSVINGLSNNYVSCISKNNIANELIIGTKKGLTVLNLRTKKTSQYHATNGLLDEEVNAITCDENGLIWIGGKNGLVSFNGKEFSYFKIQPDNNSNNIISLLIDFEKNLWIGTHNGLFKYRGKGFTSYSKDEGLGSSYIYEITKDKNGSLWITTESNGIYKYDGVYFKNYSTKDGLLSNNAKCILENEDGSIWFGNGLGISKFKNEKFENLTYSSNFKQQAPINCLFKDKQNNIWVGGKNGLCCMKKNKSSYLISNYKLPTPITNYDVWSIKQDNKGAIWAGTYLAGLYKLEGDQFINQANKTKTKIESVLEIEFDSLNNLYGATLNGVIIINTDNNKTRFISEKDGLNSELVYSIKLSKNKKHLWIGTNQGISKLSLEKINENEIDIVSYRKVDGFSGVECNTHGIYEDEQSNLWFGTVNGLIKYSPKEFIFNDNHSKTNISNFKLAFKDTILQNNTDLKYVDNNITFYFDGISLTNPDKVLYTYKLEGFDKSWSPNTDINYVKYDNLPAGKFKFKVKSCNSEGIWNIEPTTFSFIIKSPFYKTWWFSLLIIIGVASIIISIFRIRLLQIKRKQQLEFEGKVEISKSELKALRAQMNPHFVFNSLNSIQHYILNSKGKEAVKYLSKFAKLIRLILQNSEKASVTINEDLESIILYLELEKMRFEDKFNYSIIINPEVNADYDEIPPMLIQPYLENAILHGINPKEGQGNIEIEIQIVNQFIKISIKDDGIGRVKSQSLKSLQPGARHKSLGMKITKERVRILNSIYHSNLNVNIIDLYDKNNNPLGTQIDLYVPYDK